MAVRPPIALVFAAITAASLAACGRVFRAFARDDGAADAPVPAGAPTPADHDADIDAILVADRAPVADAAPGFDVKAFAGTFEAQGASLRLSPDGTYTFTVHAESADADLSTAGTWTVDADGSGLLLDPDSKDEPDQRFTITSADTLTAAAGGRVLQRDGA